MGAHAEHGPSESRRAGRARRGYVPLLHRVVALNLVVLLTAVAVTVVALAPERVPSGAVDAEAAAVAVAVALVVGANLWLLRRLIGPVHALTELARRVDLTRPGPRMHGAEHGSEAGELAATFNEMLARLESERREATGRVLAAQESERLRIAQELHDQIGQQLTAAMLGLARLSTRAPEALHGDVLAVQEGIRTTLDDVRRIAVQLRPEALDELGLPGALAVLCEQMSRLLDLRVASEIDARLPQVAAEIELVVYRVAQEALTNVARHAGVREASLELGFRDGRLELVVGDRGRGLASGAEPGAGIRGMRERATLIGAELAVGARDGEGCEVRLSVPLAGAADRCARPSTDRSSAPEARGRVAAMVADGAG